MSLMKLRHRGPGSSGGEPPINPIVNALGLNINPMSYYDNHPVFANLAQSGVWRPSAGIEADPAHIDTTGNLVSMAPGANYLTNLARTGTGPIFYRATWDGAAPIDSIRSPGGGAVVTPNPANTGNTFEWSVDWSAVIDNYRVANFAIDWGTTTSANPVMNLEIREITAFGGDVIHPGRFYSSYLQRFKDWGLSRLRFLGWSSANNYGSNGRSNFIPVTWADRSPPTLRTAPARYMVPASATTGSAASSLTFTANVALAGGTSGTRVGLLAVYPVAAIGVAGNAVTIDYGGSAPTGGVIVSGPASAINIAVTMFDGETSADQFAALWKQVCHFEGYVSGTTLTVTHVTDGRLGLGFGFHADNPNGPFVGLDMRTRIVSQTSGTPGGAGTYEIDRAGTYASVDTPYAMTGACLAQYFALITSGGAGTVDTFSGLPMAGGHDPVNPTGYAIEDIVAICNDSGSDMHYPLPAAATDDFVRGLCEYCRDNLIGRLCLAYENEVWNKAGNYVFGMFWCVAYGIASETVDQTAQVWFDPTYGYAIRYKEIMAIASDVYSATPNKLVRVLECIQHVNTSGATKFLSAGLRDCSQHTDEISTAPYVFADILPASGKNYQGLLANGTHYNKYDYGYYGDASTGKLYLATSDHVMAVDDPAADANMLEMTPDNLEPLFKASIDGQLDLSVSHRAVANAYTNDRGEKIGYSSYEGGPGLGFGSSAVTGDGAVLLTAFSQTFYTSDALKRLDSYLWHQYLTRLPSSIMCMTNEEGPAPYGMGTMWGLEIASWQTDATAPRRVAIKNAARGVFFDS